MSAVNIAEYERRIELWNWLAEFTKALKVVLESTGFEDHLKWEQQWISGQNHTYEKELRLIRTYMDKRVKQYHSPVKNIHVIINPIKCIYSAHCHMEDNSFVFSSGLLEPSLLPMNFYIRFYMHILSF